MAVFTVFVGALVWVTSFAGKKVDKIGGMLLKMSLAMVLLVGVCKLAGMLTPDEMIKGGAFAAAFVIFVGLLVKVTQIGKDKEIANVHILAKDMDDIDFMVVHKVQVNGVDRYVNCLRKAGDPIDNCPLCAGGSKPTLRLFLQLYDVNDGKLKIDFRSLDFKDSNDNRIPIV